LDIPKKDQSDEEAGKVKAVHKATAKSITKFTYFILI
jgi:hypothetical protein